MEDRQASSRGFMGLGKVCWWTALCSPSKSPWLVATDSSSSSPDRKGRGCGGRRAGADGLAQVRVES